MDPILSFYADGWVVISQEKYDSKSTKTEILTTNPSKDSWSFDDLSKNLSGKKYVPKDWYRDKLHPQLLSTASHLTKMAAGSLDRHSDVYGIYFVDYMITIDLDIQLLGVSQITQLKKADTIANNVLENVVSTVLEMEFALLAGNMEEIDELAAQNGLSWVYDERLSGSQRFHGALDDHCV